MSYSSTTYKFLNLIFILNDFISNLSRWIFFGYIALDLSLKLELFNLSNESYNNYYYYLKFFRGLLLILSNKSFV